MQPEPVVGLELLLAAWLFGVAVGIRCAWVGLGRIRAWLDSVAEACVEDFAAATTAGLLEREGEWSDGLVGSSAADGG